MIVTARPSGPVEALAKALRRRRYGDLAGAPDSKEVKALAVLESMLADLEDDRRRCLLDCLVIWKCDSEERTSHDAERASLLLDGAIVAHGSGERAFEAIKARVYDLARRREGTDIAGLVEVLHDAGIELSDGKGKATGVRVVARAAAAAAYRQRLQREGDTIRLLGVGADLPRLPLSDMDADVGAVEPKSDEEEPTEHPLSDLVRRRGRLLLTGLPGSGKSTAMRKAAAEQAAVPDAPIPLLVDLNQFAKRLQSESTLDALLGVACREAVGNEQDALRDQLTDAVAEGAATLYLDSLDETRSRKDEVALALDRFLTDQSDSLEVVVATRDSGALAGRSLGFHEARLVAPSKVTDAVEAVLRAFAVHREAENPKDWVRERAVWVKSALSRDPDLNSTPLMPILLAVTAANHADAAALPSGRAEILRQAVRDVVDQWEAGRSDGGQLRLGPLEGRRAVEALLGCFTVEGDVLAEESLPTQEGVLQELRDHLVTQWRLAPADAEATGREAIEFWDEAGFFLRDPDGSLQARVKLLSEVASSMRWTSADQADLRAWVTRTLPEPDRAESLKLAAGLSRDAAIALARGAVGSGDLRTLQTAGQAITEGAHVDDGLLGEMSCALLSIVVNGGQDGVDAAAQLAELSVPEALRATALSAFRQHLPADHALVAEVRASVRWGLEHDEELLHRFRDVLTIEQPRKLEVQAEKPGVLEFLAVDSRWAEAVVAAAEALVPRSRADAELAAPLMKKVAMAQVSAIEAILYAAGHGDLAQRERRSEMEAMRPRPGFPEWMQRSDEAEIALLQMLKSLGDPRVLSVRERRGLDELVDLIYSLRIPIAAAVEIDALCLDAPAIMRALVRAVVTLGNFDVSAVSAEAGLAMDERRRGNWNSAWSVLFIPGEARELGGWDRIAEPETLRDELIRLLRVTDLPARIAAGALLRAPGELDVFEAVLAELPTLAGRKRRLATLLALDVLPSSESAKRMRQWNEDPDPSTRRAVAAYAGFLMGRVDGVRPFVLKALADQDAEVRDEVLVALKGKPLDTELRTHIRASQTGADAWYCEHCDSKNSGAETSCGECSIVGPQLERHASELLAT